MGVVQRYTELELSGNLPRALKDPFVNEGTLFMYDFNNLSSWNGQAPSNQNNIVRDLGFYGRDATIINPTANLGFSGGLTLGGANSGYLRVPHIALEQKSLLICGWMKVGSSISASGTSLIANTATDMSGGSFMLGRFTNAQLQVRAKKESGTEITSDSFDTVLVGTMRTQDVQMVALLVNIIDAGGGSYNTQYASFWRNSEFPTRVAYDDNRTYTGERGLPASANQIGIGAYNGDGIRPNFSGKIYRAWIEDIGVSGADPLERLLEEWNFYVGKAA